MEIKAANIDIFAKLSNPKIFNAIAAYYIIYICNSKQFFKTKNPFYQLR
jgi:hypothetical protein